ncbi:MAG: methionine aminotransferase [Epsilonproteobacteria bacterium]|nr:MAG: methionine aminotransferase [Campylobacterota bacterium]
MALQSKLPNIGTNIFSVMSAMARRYDAINLSQGFPNFDCDQGLKDLVMENVEAGRNQYAPMPGIPELREIIATKIGTLYNADVDPDLNITITAGATQAIYTAIATVIRQGDNAIIFDPAYDCYAPSVLSFGGTVTPIALRAPDFAIDWDEVEEKITPDTKMIVINTPHNPLGRVLKEQDLDRLEQIVYRHDDLYVLSDEVYEHQIYDGLEHQSVLRRPGLSERSFAVYSFGKVFHITGWKVGYCVAPEHLTTEFRKMHQFITFAVNTPMQYALAAFLQDASKYMALPDFFQAKRDLFKNLMADTEFDLLPCEGSYFMLGDYSRISDLDDMAFAEWLTREHGVATIPLSPFYSTPPDQKIVRFCFAKTDDVLQSAASKLSLVINE